MRVASLVLVVLVAACGSSMKMASQAMPSAAPSMAAPAAPPPLDRSVFAHDPNGQLSEDMLQKILASPIELDLPSRVGVLPIITATDWRGPSPDFERVPPGTSNLVARLRKDAAFTLVTEMMPIPSGALGMEALREAAARYRLEVKLDDQIAGLGVRRDDSVSRERRTLRARYQLIDLSTGAVLLDATAGSDAGIDVVGSEYATTAAEKTALERLSGIVADQIVARIARYAQATPAKAAQ